MINEFKGDYSWLSNFAPVEIVLRGIKYGCVERAFMSEKSKDINWKMFCADNRNSVGDVKRMGRKVELVDGWNWKRMMVMELCIKRKFENKEFRKKLIGTGDVEIIEGNRWNDKFWGVCLKSGEGNNELGKIIMRCRSELVC